MSVERGQIRNRSRKRQIVDFSGMRYDAAITPTDVDGLIDYHNDAFAFMELKHRDAPIDKGQKLALMRVVDAIQDGGKRAALFLCSHDVDDTSRDIQADRTIVRAHYEQRQWHHVDGAPTLRAMVDLFLGYGAPRPTYQPTAGVLPKLNSDPLKNDQYNADVASWLRDFKSERQPGEEG